MTAVVLPFRPKARPTVARAMMTRDAPSSSTAVPVRLLDDANVEAAARWLNRAYAILKKAPDWRSLPTRGRVVRLRGLIDDEAREIGIDRMTDVGWTEFVRAFERL